VEGRAVGAGVGVGDAAAGGGAAGAAPVDPRTTTVPRISGWIEHRNENVPGDGNVCRERAPGASTPESNPRPVAVWARSSAFANVTLPPAAIVTDDGLKARFAIRIVPVVGAAPPPDDEVPAPPPLADVATTIVPW
jgi:hypothetical protein